MGLSEHEQKLLAELERGLMEDDQQFAAKVQKVGNPAGRMIAGVLLAIIGLGVLVTAVMLQFAPMGVAGFLVMLAGLVLATSNFRVPDLGVKTNGSTGPNRNFFEDRWDRRQGGQN